MLARTSITERLLVGAAGITLAMHLLMAGDPGGGSAPSAVVRPPRVALPDSLAWEVWSAGSRGGAADLVWRGTAARSGVGKVTIRVEYAGSADRQGLPVWPVNVWLFVAAVDDRNSFTAELSGGIDWRTGEMRVTGLVTDGPRAGAPVEQMLRLHGPRLAGTLTLRFVRSTGAVLRAPVEIGLRSE
jgi:hypothetical protein